MMTRLFVLYALEAPRLLGPTFTFFLQIIPNQQNWFHKFFINQFLFSRPTKKIWLNESNYVG